MDVEYIGTYKNFEEKNQQYLNFGINDMKNSIIRINYYQNDEILTKQKKHYITNYFNALFMYL